MVLGLVVTKVGDTWLPVYYELALACTIADTVKAHVDRFQPFLLDGVIGKAVGDGVVDLDWSGRMWVN